MYLCNSPIKCITFKSYSSSILNRYQSFNMLVLSRLQDIQDMPVDHSSLAGKGHAHDVQMESKLATQHLSSPNTQSQKPTSSHSMTTVEVNPNDQARSNAAHQKKKKSKKRK